MRISRLTVIGLLGLCALVCVLCDVTPVGMRFYMTNTGLQILASEVEAAVKASVLSIQDIPDIHFSNDALFFVDLTDFSIDDFTFTQTTSVHPAFYIDVAVDHLSMSAHSGWAYTEAGIFEGQGDGQYYCQDGSAKAQIEMREDPLNPGSLLCSVTTLDFNMPPCDLELTGEGLPGDVISAALTLLEPLFQSLVEDRLQDLITDTLNEVGRLAEEMIPTSHIWDDFTSLFYELVPEVSAHQLEGTYYGNNHFSSADHQEQLSAYDLADFSIANYRSINVTGYFNPLEDGAYAFRQEHSQDMRLTLGSQRTGSLEMHNPGMCWPEHFADELHNVMAGPSYGPIPMTVEYQSGCGGGWFKLRCRKESDNQWEQIPDLALYNNENEPSADLPVVLSNDPYPFIAVATAMRFEPIGGTIPEPEHHNIPPTPMGSTADHLQFVLDAAVLDSLAKAHVEAGWLETKSVTEAMIPDSVKPIIDLTTAFWDQYMPGLSSRWPGYDVTLVPGTVYGYEEVSVSVSEADQITMQAQTMPVSMYVVDDKESFLEHVADFSMSFDMHIDHAEITQGYSPVLLLQIDSLSLTRLSLDWVAPFIGTPASLSLLSYALGELASLVLVPAIDQALASGFPVPVPEWVGLTACRTVFSDGLIFFGTTLEFDL
ncbi:hypothetical protein KIPB_005234 [Kipferlia bialata]|uniref:PA14 domain-containing protein n=1 Tax=Kipferlia bialata TaxID=797122 RepID=A0A9K3CV18_9EUKA|nr:hypothetical protein KIPB_005234 [Kipferlia bialata]|eukprot:g5234.t1